MKTWYHVELAIVPVSNDPTAVPSAHADVVFVYELLSCMTAVKVESDAIPFEMPKIDDDPAADRTRPSRYDPTVALAPAAP